jgi:hypothetical protein
VTPDKDYGQLVNDNVFIYKPPFQGGKFEIMGVKEVCEKWDIADRVGLNKDNIIKACNQANIIMNLNK